MSKVSVVKKIGGLFKDQNYIVDFSNFSALQNGGRRNSNVMKRGALIKEAPFESVQSLDPESGIDGFDSIIREAFAVSFSLNAGDAWLPDEQVFVWTDNITALRAEIVAVLASDAAITGDVAITGDAVTGGTLVDQNNEFETM